jgi:thiamine biosynthesis lipoprotein
MEKPFSEKIEAIGSVIEVFFLKEVWRKTVKESLEIVKIFNDDFSRFQENNQLSSLNNSVGQWQEVSGEMWYLLKKGWEFNQLTDGYFNIGMIEALENLGYDKKYSFEAKVERNLGGEKLEIELKNGNLARVNKKIELGGFGKGYVLDFLKEFLEQKGLNNFLINAGGDIYAKGEGLSGNGWKIVLENPENNSYGIGEIICSDLFFAASSASKRKWRNFHHLLDESGRPAQGMLGVFVQANQGILADAMATGLFVMGMEKALEVLPGLGVEAMLIDKERKIYRTAGFKVKLY